MVGSVYFVTFNSKPGIVKIGWSGDLKQRFYSLKREYGECPTFLGVVDGGKQLEAQLHKQFGTYRVPYKREFFKLVDEILSYVKENARPYAHAITPRQVKSPPLVLALPEYVFFCYAPALLGKRMTNENRFIGLDEVARETQLTRSEIKSLFSGVPLIEFPSVFAVKLMQYFDCSLNDLAKPMRASEIGIPRIYDEFTLDLATPAPAVEAA